MIDDSRDNRDRVLDHAAIASELKQFDRLRALDPPITCAQIAERMVWTKRQTRWLLKKFKDDRP